MKIIKTSEALPKSGRYVLAWLEGAKIPMRAMWAAQHTLPLGDDADPEWGEYSEEKDEYFCPAGWYEMNQHEEQHWGVDGNVVAWCELPRLDHQCLAQIEEPAQPVLYVSPGQLANHSNPEGPESEKAGRYLPARVTPGGKFTQPLYAGAAPAAVSPRGEYPQLPEGLMFIEQIGGDVIARPTEYAYFKNARGVVHGAQLFTADQLRAYFDLGRQPEAPALEAPTSGLRQAATRALADLERAAGSIGSAVDLRAALEAPAAPLDDSDLEDLAHSANQECLSFGMSLDPFLRLAKTVRDRMLAAAPQAPAAPVGLPAQGDPAALQQLADVLESGRSLIHTERKEAADALRLQATAANAAPAAPAVDDELLELAQAIVKFNREHGSILAVHIDNLAELVDERAAQAAAKGEQP